MSTSQGLRCPRAALFDIWNVPRLFTGPQSATTWRPTIEIACGASVCGQYVTMTLLLVWG